MRDLKRYAMARDRLRKTIDPIEEYISAAEQEICELRVTVKALEELRPMWAQGWTSDSMAAQASSTALSEIWQLLGARDQTDAMGRIRALIGETK